MTSLGDDVICDLCMDETGTQETHAVATRLRCSGATRLRRGTVVARRCEDGSDAVSIAAVTSREREIEVFRDLSKALQV
jgi:hypothetical protein